VFTAPKATLGYGWINSPALLRLAVVDNMSTNFELSVAPLSALHALLAVKVFEWNFLFRLGNHVHLHILLHTRIYEI